MFIVKRKFFEIIYICQNCHFYTLQNDYLDNIINENNKNHNEKWPYIPDHPHRMVIIGGSGSGKTNALLNLINGQRDNDKIFLYAKDLNEDKSEYLIKNRENAGIKNLNGSKAFIEYSNTMDDIYENIEITIRTEKEKY